ncbi:hypothetical protein [Bradyrhizobium sp. CW7]|nr:hypothetical protein [Bradyrhizobium sp. CW7]
MGWSIGGSSRLGAGDGTLGADAAVLSGGKGKPIADAGRLVANEDM